MTGISNIEAVRIAGALTVHLKRDDLEAVGLLRSQQLEELARRFAHAAEDAS